METTVKKEKVVNVGMTEELMNFLNKWMEKMEAKDEEEKEEKPGAEVKKLIAEMAKTELCKIDAELNKQNKLDDDEWGRLMNRVDKISDIVRWY